MSTLKGSITISLNEKLSSARGLLTAVAPLSQNYSSPQVSSANAMFNFSGVISGSGDSYDLAGALEDDLGDVVVFTHVTGIVFSNESSSTSMNIGTAPNPLSIFNSATPVAKNSQYMYKNDNGLPVGAGSTDQINISGTSGEAYKLSVFGIS